MSKVNRLENFEMVKLHRSEIQGAPYNPRKITEDAKKKLRKLIKKHGMVQPIIVNKKTMNLVGGHQRLSLMDSELRTQDYELTVAMIEVSEKQEIELNISLNNTGAQGSWDTELLESIKIEHNDIDFLEDLAFDAVDIETMFFDSEVFFPREEQVLNNENSNDPVKELEKQAKLDKIKEAKREHKKQMREDNSDGVRGQVMDDDYILRVKFNSNQEKWDFMKGINKPLSETHLSSGFMYDLADGKLTCDPKSKTDDSEIHIVFQTNSEKAEFLKNARIKPGSQMAKPEIFKEIESGKINLKGDIDG